MNVSKNINGTNLLFIGNQNSIHDLKWVEHLANLHSNKIFFLPTSPKIDNILSSYDSDKFKNIIFLKPLPAFSIIRINKLLKGRRYLKNIITQNNINLMHISFAAPNALWALVVKVNYIITIHGSDILVVIPNLLNKCGLRSFYNKFLWKLFRKAFLKANAITCASSHIKDKFVELFGNIENLHIIRSGVDVNYICSYSNNWADGIPNECKIIFFPRLISEIYDTYLQIQAIDFLPDEILKNYYFVFIGYNDTIYSNKILKKLDELKSLKGIKYKFYSFISQNQMFALMKRSSLVIMTPLSDGTPSSALEAMVLEKPLIVSDLKYDAEIFDNNCLKLTERTPQKLASLIVEALNDYSPIMLSNAYEAVIKYGNISVEMQKLQNIYDSVLVK